MELSYFKKRMEVVAHQKARLWNIVKDIPKTRRDRSSKQERALIMWWQFNKTIYCPLFLVKDEEGQYLAAK